MKFKAKSLKEVQKTGLQLMAISFSAPALFQGYDFKLLDYIEIYNLHIIYPCCVMFPDINNAAVDNSIFESVSLIGAPIGLVINDPFNSSLYAYPTANTIVRYSMPLVVKRFIVTKLSSGISLNIWYKPYKPL